MFKKLVYWFQKVSLIISIIILVFVFIPMAIGITPDIVISGSMEPEIKAGDIVYVNTHINVKKIKEQDVIKFSAGKEESIIHRVARINEDGSFVTKGDSNDIEDSIYVKAESVEGKKLFSIPYFGKLLSKVKSQQGIGIIFIFVFLNMLCIVFDKKIYSKEEKDEKTKDNKVSEDK